MSTSEVIFISYRRSDADGLARLLHLQLQQRFEDSALFFDRQSIEHGDVFTECIARAMAPGACGAAGDWQDLAGRAGGTPPQRRGRPGAPGAGASVAPPGCRLWKTGKGEEAARISFATPELLWQVLTAKRWVLLKALCGADPVSILEAAKRVGRDVKAVSGDVTALLNAGVLERAEQGGIVFPYDAVKVEFLLRAA